MPMPWEPPPELPKATLLDHDETGLMLDSKGEYFQQSRKSTRQSEDSDPDNKDYFRRPRFRSP